MGGQVSGQVSGPLEAVQQMVRGCEACHLRGGCVGPVPVEGRVQARYLFVGEAPGRNEDEQGRPFIGGAGKLLREVVRRAGVFSREVAYTNVVRCRPEKNRTPVQGEVEACRHNLAMEMAVMQARVVVLVGATAFNVFRPDLQVSKHHSIPMMLSEGRVAVGCVHPAAAMRQPAMERDVERAVKEAKKRAVKGVMADWPEGCVVCGGEGAYADSMGVFYCAGHEWKRDRWRESGRQRMMV